MQEQSVQKKDSEHNLSEQFERLTDQLSRYTSYKAVFARGVVYGVGTAIGATVIAAVLFGVAYRLFQPVVDDVSSEGVLEDVFNAEGV